MGIIEQGNVEWEGKRHVGLTAKAYPNVRVLRIPLWGDFADRDGSTAPG